MTSKHAHQLDAANPSAVSDLVVQLVGELRAWPGYVDSDATDAIPAGRQLLSVQRALSQHGIQLPIVEYRMLRLDGDAEYELLNRTSAWALCLPDGRQADAWGSTSADEILSGARRRANWPQSSFAIMSSPVDATTLCDKVSGFMREQSLELDAYMARQALFLVLDHTTAKAQGMSRSPRL